MSKVTFVFVWLVASSPLLAGSGQITIVVDPRPTTESASRELVSLEAFKLLYGGVSQSPAVELPAGNILDSAIRDRLEKAERERLGQLAVGKDLRPKGPLTLPQILKAITIGVPLTQAESEELLGTLRAQDAKGRLSGSLGDRARVLLVEELRAWAMDGRAGVPLTAALKAALAEQLRDQAAKAVPPRALTDVEIEAALKSPAILAELVASLKPTAFSALDWVRMAGGMRLAARVARPNTFLADMRFEIDRRLADVGAQNQISRGIKAPRIAFSAPRPSFQIGSTPSPAPNLPGGNRGFDAQPNFRGEGGTPGKSGSVALDEALPGNISLTAEAKARLKAERDRAHVSLPLITHYAKSESSSCQITLVGEKREVGAGKCTYNAATARHCVEDDGGALFTHAEIPPFASIQVTRVEADDTGGDLAMMAFESDCRSDVPMASLALTPPREGEGIVVHAAFPLLGQASSNGGSTNRLMMNVRDPENGGTGIEHGNSGGAVLNEKGELVGVISTKIASPDGQGIGFFASREALYFANRFLNPDFDGIYLGGYRKNIDRGTASIKSH